MKSKGWTSLPAGLRPVPPALINPVRGPQEAGVPPRVLLAFTRPDVKMLTGLLQTTGEPWRRLWNCDLRRGAWQGLDVLLAGPLLGGPQTAMVMEKLIVLGAEALVGLGWCGSLAREMAVGSLLLPEAAFGGDGTSPHYRNGRQPVRPHAGLHRLLAEGVQDTACHHGLACFAGPVWSTDAVFRETAALVERARARGALAMEMEMAAFFAVGAFRRVAVAGLLVVSDELLAPAWQLGAHTPRCRQAREVAARAALAALAAWEVS